MRVAYTANPNRATKVQATVAYSGGTDKVAFNQRTKPPIDGAWMSLGTFEFAKGKGGSVTITNDGADGFVVIDAVQWVPIKK